MIQLNLLDHFKFHFNETEHAYEFYTDDGSISKKEGTFQINTDLNYAVALFSSSHKCKAELEKQFETLLLANFYC